jgi:hypothetical protein
MASYVIIWENNTIGHQKVRGLTWAGHAAMNIGDIFDKGRVHSQLNSYVSWWPEHTTHFDVRALFSKAQAGHTHVSLLSDINSEEYLPDHVICMKSTDAQEGMMRAEWRSVFLKEGGSSYKNLHKNCSTIVSRVLHAGGFHARKWSVESNWVWTPSDVAKLARAAGGKHMTWEQFLGVLKYSDITWDQMIDSDTNMRIERARSGVYCSTGVPVWHQEDALRPTY